MPLSDAKRRHCCHKSGQVIPLTALFLTILLVFIAIAVDGARYHYEQMRLTKVADLAALSAAQAYSTGGTTALQSTVNTLVNRNTNGDAHITAAVTIQTGPPVSARIDITESGFVLVFGHIAGLLTANLSASATAAFPSPVSLGNPTNTIGYPTSVITTMLPITTTGITAVLPIAQGLSLAINGPDQFAESGDPYSALTDLGNPSIMSVSTPINNPWRTAVPGGFNGYNYTVSIPSGATGATYIQVYDAATCYGTAAPFSDTMGSASYGLPYNGNPVPAPPITKNDSNGVPQPYEPFPTYFRLYAQDPTTGITRSLTSSDVLARGPVTDGSLPPDTVIAPTQGMTPTITNGTYTPPSCGSAGLAPFVGKWYTLAKVDASQSGTYVINVNTCLDQNNPGPQSQYGNLPSCEGTETNSFALRAITTGSGSASTTWCDGTSGHGSDPQTTATLDCQSIPANSVCNNPSTTCLQPQIAGQGSESVRIQASTGSAGTAILYLSRLDPSYAGAWVRIGLFDPGDLPGGSSMQIVRPDGTYAPLLWSTTLLDGNGSPLSTTLQNNGSTSLVTSFPMNGLALPTASATACTGPCPTTTPYPLTATPTATPPWLPVPVLPTIPACSIDDSCPSPTPGATSTAPAVADSPTPEATATTIGSQ